MEKIGEQSKNASFYLTKSSVKKRNNILKKFVKYLKKNKSIILKANKKDLFQANFCTSFVAVSQFCQSENGTSEQLEQAEKNFFTQSALSK